VSARSREAYRLGGERPDSCSDVGVSQDGVVVAVRTTTLRVLRADGELEALRKLSDRREELTRLRVQTVNRLRRPLAELGAGHGTELYRAAARSIRDTGGRDSGASRCVCRDHECLLLLSTMASHSCRSALVAPAGRPNFDSIS
jgi:transposase